MALVYENRVRFAETDQQGIVFYGTFFTYQDESFNAFLRGIDYRYSRMEEEGWTTHIVHADLDYHAPARFEDVIENELRVSVIGDTSITIDYVAHRSSDQALLADGSAVHVTVDTDSDESVVVPDTFRNAVIKAQAEPPDPV